MKQDSIICRKQNTCSVNYEKTKTSSRRTNEIETLSERLGSLQINKEASTEEYEQTDTEMSVAPAAVAVSKNVQAGLPKNMILDPG